MYFDIDPEFQSFFRDLKQVFLYIIDDCNLSCIQCLYKANLTFQLKSKVIEVDDAVKLASDFHEMGASKLTIMGGEPTLYGQSEKWKPLCELIRAAKNIGYEYVRIDTNGQFPKELLEIEDFRKLDAITFSLDGPTPTINDSVRGTGTFEACVANIKHAVSLGYTVDVTTCVHRGLFGRDPHGVLWLEHHIHFAESLGIVAVNFHDLFKSGIPRDAWSGNVDITLDEWLAIYPEIQEKASSGRFGISVRIPQSFIHKDDFGRDPKYLGYCSVKTGDRVLVHPDGIIRVCSLMIGSPYGIARYYRGKITWDNSPTNEIRDHKLGCDTPCTNQGKDGRFGKYVPLCVSFKPKQEEFVWQKLGWEDRRTKN